MIITGIKQIKQHQSLIEFSDGSSIVIDRDTCAENRLSAGDEISESGARSLLEDSEYTRARSRALWYLDSMDYSGKTLCGKLVMKGFDREVSARVIEDLRQSGIINDTRYARRLAEKLAEKNSSKREILQKLVYKGVPYALAKEILGETDIDEDKQLITLIETKYLPKLHGPDGYRKVYAALVRKGFSYGAVSSALKKYSNNTQFSEDY